jgi:hypothetical protein
LSMTIDNLLSINQTLRILYIGKEFL